MATLARKHIFQAVHCSLNYPSLSLIHLLHLLHGHWSFAILPWFFFPGQSAVPRWFSFQTLDGLRQLLHADRRARSKWGGQESGKHPGSSGCIKPRSLRLSHHFGGHPPYWDSTMNRDHRKWGFTTFPDTTTIDGRTLANRQWHERS